MVQRSIAFQTELERDFHQIRSEIKDLRQMIAARRRDSERRDIKCQLAALRFETALIRYARACQKAGFRQDQPRWPKGSEEGGRWSGEGGTGSGQTTDLSAMRRKPPMPGLPVHLPRFSPGTSSPATPREPVTIINNAQTGLSTVDETTEKLRTILEKVVSGRPEGFGPEYGKTIHYDFAGAVKSENLRGIGREGVEQTFGPDPDDRDVPYGFKGSIRTDVVLRNDTGDVIAIYDVKTGNASLGPRRVQQLRERTNAPPRIPMIEMHIQRGLSLKAQTEQGRYFWVITLRLWNP